MDSRRSDLDSARELSIACRCEIQSRSAASAKVMRLSGIVALPDENV